MSSKIDDGGTAFPTIHGYVDSFGSLKQKSTGLSLRDWFAGQALIGLMSYPGDEFSGNWHNNSSSQGVATRCYDLADAMISARGEK